MIKIWGRTNSVNVQKVLWCLDEIGLPYERIDAGLQFGKNNEPWYLALNPNGRIPLLQDGEFSLWESNTIVRYLSSKYDPGGLYAESPETRALAERWMDWQLSTLLAPVSTVFWTLIRTPAAERDMSAVTRATAEALFATTSSTAWPSQRGHGNPLRRPRRLVRIHDGPLHAELGRAK